MSEPRLRILFIPSTTDVGPYRSLERVERSTRDALGAAFEVVEPESHPSLDRDGYLAEFERCRPFDAVLDLSDHALHGPVAPDIPTLFYALGNMPNGATLPWLRRSRMKTSDVILMNCTSDLAIHDATLEGSGPRGELLPLGVDTDVFHPRAAADNAATRAALGVPADAFMMLFAGRLNKQKNIHSLLLVLRELATRDEHVHLVLAGEPDSIGYALFNLSNEGYEDELQAMIHGWGLDDRVHFVGKLGDQALAGAYAAADVFITLTLHNNENFGYAPVEAMACGTPVIGAHFGGIKDTVVHGATGFHVETLMTDNGLRTAWRQAIEPARRLASDPALRTRLGAAGVDRVQRHYSVERFAQRLQDVIRETAARARSTPAAPGTSFRFSKPAMELHLANLYRTYLRAEGKKKRERTGMRVPYPLYRWFQAPYTTRDIAGLILAEDATLSLVTRCRIDRKRHELASLDPIWPQTYAMSPAELDMIASIEPGTRVGDIVARGRALELDDEVIRGHLQQLLREGVVFPDRPFSADT